MNRIRYNAILYKPGSSLDGLPIELHVGQGIDAGSRFRRVDPLCNNATEKEIRWYKENVEPCIVKGEINE